MLVRLVCDKFIELTPKHQLNASLPILINPPGNVIDVRAESRNVASLMVVIFVCDKFIVVRPHASNALAPMLVRVDGSSILVRVE